MTDLALSAEPRLVEDAAALGVRPLSAARPGERGVILRVGHGPETDPKEAEELERRLLELGFVEGATVELLHQGLIGRDPIAVKVDDMRVALRRREAGAVDVRFEVAS